MSAADTVARILKRKCNFKTGSPEWSKWLADSVRKEESVQVACSRIRNKMREADELHRKATNKLLVELSYIQKNCWHDFSSQDGLCPTCGRHEDADEPTGLDRR